MPKTKVCAMGFVEIDKKLFTKNLEVNIEECVKEFLEEHDENVIKVIKNWFLVLQ